MPHGLLEAYYIFYYVLHMHCNAICRYVYSITDIGFIESAVFFSIEIKPLVYFSIHIFRADECVLMCRPWL